MSKFSRILISILGLLFFAGCAPSLPEPTPTATIVPTATPEPDPYEEGMRYYRRGDFSQAIIYFEKAGDINDSKERLAFSKTMQEAQGEWFWEYGRAAYPERGGEDFKIKVSGWNVIELGWHPVFGHEINEYVYRINRGEIADNKLTAEHKTTWGTIKYIVYDSKDGMKIQHHDDSKAFIRLKTHDFFYIPDIGMTDKDVLNSLWGEPVNISRRKSASGETQRWKYTYSKDSPVLYLVDGIVTEIFYH